MQRFVNFCLAVITISLIGYIFLSAKLFFLPLLCAVVMAYIIVTGTQGVRLFRIKGYRPPYWIAMSLVLVSIVLITQKAITMIGNNLASLMLLLPDYQEKLLQKMLTLHQVTGIPIKAEYSQWIENVDLIWLTKLAFGGITDLISNTGMIAIYLMFLLIECRFFDRKIHALIPDEIKRKKTMSLIQKATSKINSYLKIKTFVSALTAFFSYMVLIFWEVNFPEFFAFLIFFLNFIPVIGSIFAMAFPCLLTFIQFDNFAPFIFVTLFLGLIQMIIGNILEPRMIGNSFSLSGFAIIISLSFWGAIWGVVGMFLSVPITVMAFIALANFSQTRWLAILLSRDGQVE
ncbi:MAG: AI-2 transport protein TqsA [Chlamydiales bacterium]|jgi:AI-2 transport protein TqsA